MTLRPGQIVATVAVADGAVRHADVHLDPPLQITAALAGRPAEAVPPLLKAIYALCGEAHAAAASLALARAGGRPEPDRAAADGNVLRERVAGGLRDFALAFSQGAMTPGDVSLLRALQADRAPPGFHAVATGLLQRCEAWAHTLGQDVPEGAAAVPPPPLQPEDDDAVALHLAASADATHATAPEGVRRETGAYARWGKPSPRGEFAARLAARLEELAWAVDALERPAASLTAAGQTGPREGWAAVDTGRGRLYHWAALDGQGRVTAYRILAPVDWNFRPGGPFAASLSRLRGTGCADIERQAALLARLCDPCMPCTIRVAEVAHA